MIRRPPRSTPFPTRRSSDLDGRRRHVDAGDRQELRRHHRRDRRSEEHTSELQSLAYLVCRLLLEKKKKKNNTVYRVYYERVMKWRHTESRVRPEDAPRLCTA